jgi:hypothetical protein
MNKIWYGCIIEHGNLILERGSGLDGELVYVCERCLEVIAIPWSDKYEE